MGERIGVYRDLMGKAEGNRPLGRSRRRWEDNIRWSVLVNAVMNFGVP
jgi:hypothetical protein